MDCSLERRIALGKAAKGDGGSGSFGRGGVEPQDYVMRRRNALLNLMSPEARRHGTMVIVPFIPSSSSPSTYQS